MHLAVLLLALALAPGCLAPLAEPAPEEDAARKAFLSAGMGLAPEAEAAESWVRAGSFFAAWAQGTDYPTWRSEAFAAPRYVENLSLTLRLRVTAPVAETARFPDVMAYGGAGEAWVGYGNATTPSVLVPGNQYAFEFPIAPPEGGLWIPRGERLGVKAVPVMTQGDVNDVEILVGGPFGSFLAWRERAAPEEGPLGPVSQKDGEATGSAYAGAAAPATTFQRFPVTLPARPAYLLAWMNVTSAQGIPDVDLFVEDADGRQIAGSGTPTPREMIRLGPGNLPLQGNVTLVVASYGSARAAFSVAWATGSAPDART